MRRVKRVYVLLLAVLLTLSSLISTSAAAEQPDPWAADAMAFALEHHLLAPEEVAPKQPAARGQLAAITVRLLQLQQRADLSGYSDVTPSTLYYESLSKAVAIGLLEGNGSQLSPRANLTREQAITILARCFGVPDGDTSSLERYSDHMKVSDWAAGPVAGMIAEGYVKGSDAQLSPQSTITQQELAHLIRQMAGTIVTDGVVPAQGSVTLQTWGGLISDLTVNGNLYLCGSFQQVELHNVQVTGRLVIYGGSVQLTGTSSAKTIVCRGPGVTLSQTGSSPVQVSSGTATLSGGGPITAEAPVTLQSGSYPQVEVLGSTVTLEAGAQVELARLLTKGSIVTGAGTVTNAVLLHPDCNVTAAVGQVQTTYDPGIQQVKITAAQSSTEPTPTSPAFSTTIQFDQVDVATGLGVSNGARYCTLSWYVDGVLVKKQRNFPLANGGQATLQTTTSYTGRVSATTTVVARLTYGDETKDFTRKVDKHIEKLSSPVRTMDIEATVRRTTTLYSGMKLTGKLGTVPAGTKVIYTSYSQNTSRKIRLPDGRTGWVGWNDLNISTKNYTRYTDYTQTEKENYVNISGYQSTTKYLVWVSRLTQKVNVFEGSYRDWTLIHAFSCATGANTTPTIPGVFRYQYRVNLWDFDTYYVRRPMIFNGGHAFHTRTYRNNGTLLDATIGRPISHGCIRMYDEDVDWMWNNMPIGTTVVVY